MTSRMSDHIEIVKRHNFISWIICYGKRGSVLDNGAEPVIIRIALVCNKHILFKWVVEQISHTILKYGKYRNVSSRGAKDAIPSEKILTSIDLIPQKQIIQRDLLYTK